jgi:putative ABC transport system ATP-binding protein
MAPVLKGLALTKRYETDDVPVDALRGLDIAVERGEFVAIMGPSGCGKSTLLHLLGGLDRPTSGRVELEGADLAAMPDDELTTCRRDRFGFVFQFFNLIPVLTAAENVGLPSVIAKRDAAERSARVAGLLAQVGLAEHATKLPSQLSGGQQQRVAIARALCNEPAVLLADEPTGNLDHRSGLEIIDIVRGLHAQGQTIILVTHDPVVAAAAQRVVFLRDGVVADEVRPTGARSLLRKLTSLSD